ncbi:MAG TPA: tRNA (adenosine(37)-N6)-threonylcarbamoyltransferase complex dimerization subunit type 1 TsaB [Methylophilaceae bacterium]|nr:tRNA (adenosine(37)-N6)-threonylcarbamoyltransferase complex dimerization subunit type 1 TsaB [Methylophilaceae bacterium]
MKILALDTSTEYLSLALWQDGALLVRELLAGQKHSELVLPLVGELLAEAGLQLPNLDGIAFGAGPGSFTGLRIGCGVAQGLAFGANLPVVGVCTLEALAEQAGAKRVIACLDARMQEVYHAAYERDGERWREILPPGLYPPPQVPAVHGGGWCAIGSGWDNFGPALDAVYGTRIERKIAGAFPLARHMAELAVPRFAKGEGKPPHEAAPLYVRNKVAFTIREREAAR